VPVFWLGVPNSAVAAAGIVIDGCAPPLTDRFSRFEEIAVWSRLPSDVKT
jgi:hypothetical protein